MTLGHAQARAMPHGSRPHPVDLSDEAHTGVLRSTPPATCDVATSPAPRFLHPAATAPRLLGLLVQGRRLPHRPHGGSELAGKPAVPGAGKGRRRSTIIPHVPERGGRGGARTRVCRPRLTSAPRICAPRLSSPAAGSRPCLCIALGGRTREGPGFKSAAQWLPRGRRPNGTRHASESRGPLGVLAVPARSFPQRISPFGYRGGQVRKPGASRSYRAFVRMTAV